MATSDTQNVVVNSQSVGVYSPIDAHASQLDSAFNASGANGTLDSESGLPHTPNAQTKVALAETNGDLTRADSSTGADAAADLSNGVEREIEGKSAPDGISVQGSVPDTDSSRDTTSVGDGLDSSAALDSDTAREGGEQLKDTNGNVKANAVKKLTSFKAVSVTKNFMAKTATSTPISKPGERATISLSAPQAIAKPRLVAKSGSGLRDTPRPRPGPDGATDGSTVWNKNRPAPPAPQKQFTDEELKQQYGIHLASRIQADDSKKGSKWADIDDDDEDDWAPETVEWMDGTKSKINPEPAQDQQQPPAPQADQPRPLEVKPTLTPLKRPPATGPPKTILRPGASQLAKIDSSSASNTPEPNSAFGSKTPAPVPAKSPWAALPPVDKSLPVFQPPQQMQQRPVFASQDARNSMVDTVPITAHEMEADTFDRSWREPERSQRELFNSHSGRYEPVEHDRRGSFRHDQGHRQPAVLQRPGHDEAIDSASYQTRSSQEGSPWSRRRGSSFSHQNGAPFERRVSVNKAADPGTPAETRTGIVIGHDIGPQAKYDPKQAQKEQQQVNDRNEDIVRQKKLMQEKRELAIRRRKEEEAKEEAAKKERIRLKLESLGPMPVKPPVTGEVDTSVPSAMTPSQPPAQYAAGEHQSSKNMDQPTSQPPVLSNAQANAGTNGPVSPQKQSSSPYATQAHVSRPSPSRNLQESATATSAYSSPGEHKVQPVFKSPALPADSFATWGNRTTSAQNQGNSNPIWGPPGSLRHIGNGAFDGGYSRISSRLQNQSSGMQQGQVSDQQSPLVNHRQETSPMRHQQMLSDQNLAALGLVDTPTDVSSAASFAGQHPVPVQPQPAALQPIGPPTRHNDQAFQHQVATRGVAAWGQMAARAQTNQSNASAPTAQSQQPAAADDDDSQTWKETFKQTKIRGAWSGGQRQVVQTDRAAHNSNLHAAPAPPVSQSQPSNMLSAPNVSSRESTVRLPNEPSNFGRSPGIKAPTGPRAAHNNVQSHQSRFFPTAANGGSPPPEEASHPVYNNVDKGRPTVNLPRAKPNVRLPPSSIDLADQSGHVTMLQRTPSYRAGAQPLVHSQDWQARFNGLFGRVHTTTATPPSPPKTPPKGFAIPSPAPISSSRADIFEQSDLHYSTSVSLPGPLVAATSGRHITFTSKASSEALFDDELSFGSRPKTNIPTNPIYRPGPHHNTGRHLLKMVPSARFDRRIEPSSRTALLVDAAAGSVTVHLPNSKKFDTFKLKHGVHDGHRKSSAKFGRPTKNGANGKENTTTPASSPAPKSKHAPSRKVSSQTESPKSTAQLNGTPKPQRQASFQAKGPKVTKFVKSRQAPEKAHGSPQAAKTSTAA